MENEKKSPGRKKNQSTWQGTLSVRMFMHFTQESVPVSLSLLPLDFLSISSALGVSFLPDLADSPSSDVLPERRHLSGRRRVVSQ